MPSLGVAMSGAPIMDRRVFLGACGCGAATLLGCASVVTTPVPVADGRIRLRLADHPALALPGGSLKIAPVGRRDPIVVVVLDDGSHAALSPICTHRGCTVDVQGARLVCPCHGSTYDRSGAVLRGPAERPLARYDVTSTGDVVEIALRDPQ